jgi:phosphopantetheinyl transferase
MPFTQESLQINQISIHLLYYEAFDALEYLAHLTPLEQERFFTFSNPTRQQEFVATRILRHSIFGFQHIHYTDIGSPYIEGAGFISISHCPGVVGIALCHEHTIGLDLEIISGKAKRVCTKFLSEKEFQHFDCDNELEMTRVWSAKEALYKLANRKSILFQNELEVSKSSNEIWQGKIVQPSSVWFFELTTFVHKNFVVTINTSSAKPEK